MRAIPLRESDGHVNQGTHIFAHKFHHFEEDYDSTNRSPEMPHVKGVLRRNSA